MAAGTAKLLPESLVPWALKENARKAKAKTNPFRAVEGTPGFYKTLRATLSELRQGGFTSSSLADSAKAIAKDKSRRRLSEKLESFAGVLEQNEAWKREKRWKDLEDLYVDTLTLAPPADLIWTYGFMTLPSSAKRRLGIFVLEKRDCHVAKCP